MSEKLHFGLIKYVRNVFVWQLLVFVFMFVSIFFNRKQIIKLGNNVKFHFKIAVTKLFCSFSKYLFKKNEIN